MVKLYSTPLQFYNDFICSFCIDCLICTKTHNTLIHYNISAKIKIILDLHHEIYTLLDTSLAFHSDTSTFEMPEVTHICSLYFSHSLYVILKSSYSWQCRLTATYRHR